ncbi:hypothetical protein FA13DRAFT_1590497, partial [Coprinellus micaceus]
MTNTKTKTDMPAPGTRGAPKFSGRAKKLEEFWEAFKDAAKACNVMDDDKAEVALRYVKRKMDKRLWKALEGYEGPKKNYANWKKAVNDIYTEDEKDYQMDLTDLNKLIHRNSKKKISKERHLLKYHRNFILVANPLVTDSTIAPQQKDIYFWQGFHPKNQKAILERVNVLKASTHKPSDILTINDVLEAGKFLYSSRSFEQRFRLKKAKGNEDEQRKKRQKQKGKALKKKKVEVTTKRVSFDMGRVEDPEKKRLDEVEELSRKLSSMRVNDTAYA